MTSNLPPHVYALRDRHGKRRYRFQRKHWRTTYLPGAPGEAAFHEAYAAIIAAGPPAPDAVASPTRVTPRSLDDLLARMKAGTRWRKKTELTRRTESAILQRFMDKKASSGRRYGERPAAMVSVAWLDRVLAGMAETPGAANKLRKVLGGLLDHAIRLGWRADNPARLTERYSSGTGFAAWSEDDIARFRARHALGTTARLTLELALNTAARRCNIATLTRDDIAGGRIAVAHAKGNHQTDVPLLATTRAALDALAATPIRHLIVTGYGKPFTVAGLGNKMRQWCDEAGLPGRSMHGLRKAVSRRIAESGGTDAEGQAVTGHRKAETFAHYRATANRTALADTAFHNLESRFGSQP